MNKVFEIDPLEPVEVAVHEPAVPSPAPAQPAAQQPVQSPPPKPSTGLISLLTLVAVAGTVSSGWLLSHWQSSRDQLAQERSMLMLERLRGPSSPGSATPQATSSTSEASSALPPPPPEPAWMRELEPLTTEETQLPPLASSPLATAQLSSAPLNTAPQGPIPQLSGVVQGPGGNSSAIFQLGSNSFSAGVGEAIGSSGWVLESISEAGAVISRNGQQHNLAVGGGF